MLKFSAILSIVIGALTVTYSTKHAYAFGGETLTDGQPWHHLDITLRALAGDAQVTGTGTGTDANSPLPAARLIYPGVGFSREAAMSIAWHADNLDSYLYNPLFWAKAGLTTVRVKAALVGYPEMVKLHFDDLFNAPGLIDTWNRYAAGTLIGLYWAFLNNDVAAAQHILGISAHAVADFYSHSNWIDDPNRRTRIWQDTPLSEREQAMLYTGTYELPESAGAYHHGKITPSCTALRDTNQGGVIDSTLNAICIPYSPFENSAPCAARNECRDAHGLQTKALNQNVNLFITPPGIALDSAAMAAVQAGNRKLVDGTGTFSEGQRRRWVSMADCDPIVHFGLVCQTDGKELCSFQPSSRSCTSDSDRVFATAKDLAIRSVMKWFQTIETEMTKGGSPLEGPQAEAFWKRVKTEGSSIPERASQFENIGKLPYQFLSAGPYPVGNESAMGKTYERSAAGTYFRILLKTANTKGAGTDADIYVDVGGKSFLLDHVPTKDPKGRTQSSLLVYNDFEANDRDVYTVGPIPTVLRPDAIRLRNASAGGGDVARQILKSVGQSFDRTLETAKGIFGGGMDYVGKGQKLFTSDELVKLTENGRVHHDLRVDGKDQGFFRIGYTVDHASGILNSREERDGWCAYTIELTRLAADRESKNDRDTSSDETFFFLAINSLGTQQGTFAYRSQVFGGINSGDSRNLRDSPPDQVRGDAGPFNRFIVKVRPHSILSISTEVFESDSESAKDRTNAFGKFLTGIDKQAEEQAPGVLDALGSAVAADWNLEYAEIFAFDRSTQPSAGYVLRKKAIGEIKGGESREIKLDWSGMQPLNLLPN